MNRLLRWLDGVLVRQEQIDELHSENMALRADLEALNRVHADTQEQLYEAHGDLLDHHYGFCSTRGSCDRT